MTPKNFLQIGDNIIAQIACNGHMLASVCHNNFSSIDDVVACLLSQAGRFMGLARVTIRNKTQGRSTELALANRRQARPSLALAS